MASILDLQQFAENKKAIEMAQNPLFQMAAGFDAGVKSRMAEDEKIRQLKRQAALEQQMALQQTIQDEAIKQQNSQRMLDQFQRTIGNLDAFQSAGDDRTMAGDVKRVASGDKAIIGHRKVRLIPKGGIKIKDGAVSTELSLDVEEPKPLSPILQNAKDKRLEDVVMTVQDYNVKRDSLSEAVDAMNRIEGGRYGALNRLKMRELDPNNPALEDWQKLKIVLLDETLANTIKTKGAISDREMELFQKAAANDDVFSVKASIPVLRRALKKMNAEEKSKVISYKNLYKEDPYQLEGVESNISKYENLFSNKGQQNDPMVDVKIESVGIGNPQTTPKGTTYRVLE